VRAFARRVVRVAPYKAQNMSNNSMVCAAAHAAYDDLAARYDVIVAEGAGSPAEINLRAGDYANMGLARHAGLPAVIVGDIDLGGVFAALCDVTDADLLGDLVEEHLDVGALLELARSGAAGGLPVLPPAGEPQAASAWRASAAG
jgi:hypothetical protein